VRENNVPVWVGDPGDSESQLSLSLSLSLSLFLFSLWRLTPTTQERREKREEGGRKEMRAAQRVERRSDGSEHIAW
jgi:hypothetical protein